MVFIQPLIVSIGLVTSFFLGQLARLNLGSFSLPIIDVFIVILAIYNLFTRPKLSNKPFLWFLVYSWLNLFLNFFIHHQPLLIASSYLIRLSCILLLFIFPPKIDIRIKKYFVLAILANITFGLIQYFLWPDLTYFKSIGWDDHLNRLVSTFMDPTFTGLIYLMFLIHLFFNKKNLLPVTYYVLLFISFIAIALTYSRSTFLALIICSLFLTVILKKIKLFLFGFALIVLAIIFLPRSPGEGTKLERTSSIIAKNVNLKEGVALFISSPTIGFGYNNLPSIKKSTSHSSSGFDSSLLTILTTTGVIGLSLFLLGFYQLYIKSTLEIKTMLVAIFIHSLFANSLLYPFTLIFLILI